MVVTVFTFTMIIGAGFRLMIVAAMVMTASHLFLCNDPKPQVKLAIW